MVNWWFLGIGHPIPKYSQSVHVFIFALFVCIIMNHWNSCFITWFVFLPYLPYPEQRHFKYFRKAVHWIIHPESRFTKTLKITLLFLKLMEKLMHHIQKTWVFCQDYFSGTKTSWSLLDLLITMYFVKRLPMASIMWLVISLNLNLMFVYSSFINTHLKW